MKLDALDHPKTHALASALDISRPTAIGYLELLWAFTGKNAPQGNIGKWPNGAIARACDWTGSPDEFVAALVAVRTLDRDDVHRLLVHDWHEHAPGWVRAKIKDHGFIVKSTKSVDGSPPSSALGSPPGSPPSSTGGSGPSILGQGNAGQGNEASGTPARDVPRGTIDHGTALTGMNLADEALASVQNAWRDVDGCDPGAMTAWIAHWAAMHPGRDMPGQQRIAAAKLLAGLGDAGTQRRAVATAEANGWKALRHGDGQGPRQTPQELTTAKRIESERIEWQNLAERAERIGFRPRIAADDLGGYRALVERHERDQPRSGSKPIAELLRRA